MLESENNLNYNWHHDYMYFIKRGYPSLENSRGNETTHAILLKEENKWLCRLTAILTVGRLKGILITLYYSLTNNWRLL